MASFFWTTRYIRNLSLVGLPTLYNGLDNGTRRNEARIIGPRVGGGFLAGGELPLSHQLGGLGEYSRWWMRTNVLSAKVFKLSFEYLHIYSPKVAIFAEKNSNIALTWHRLCVCVYVEWLQTCSVTAFTWHEHVDRFSAFIYFKAVRKFSNTGTLFTARTRVFNQLEKLLIF